MGITLSWKLISIILLYSVGCLNNSWSMAVAIDVLDESESDTHESFEQPEIWSSLLEELTINSSTTDRDGRAIQHPYKYIPTSNIYINRRVDNLVPLGPSAYKQNFQFQGASSGGPSSANQFFNNRVPPNQPSNGPNGLPSLPNGPINAPSNGPSPFNGPEVSETDLYLLSAIEKLVYRVDYMERRLRKTEQLVYYLMAGNNEHKKEIPEKPCSMNFTRVGDNCYLFVTNQLVNWKTANNICRSYGAHLAELEALNENNDMAAFLLNHQQELNGNGNFWLGGLNPGLLWIWSSSARPVNPNVNLTQIHNTTNSAVTSIAPKVSTKIDNHASKKAIVNKKGSSTNSTTTTINEKKPVETTKIMATDADFKIEGNGRCLGLSYKYHKHIYQLYGLDCMSQQKFICELPQDHIDNEIDRIAKKLFH